MPHNGVDEAFAPEVWLADVFWHSWTLSMAGIQAEAADGQKLVIAEQLLGDALRFVCFAMFRLNLLFRSWLLGFGHWNTNEYLYTD